MKAGWRSASLAAAAVAALAAAPVGASLGWTDSSVQAASRSAQARSVISGWPAYSALAARAMIEEYGPPDEVAPDRLAWARNGPWVRTVVYRQSQFPFSAQDVLEQTVNYAVPQERWPALAGFGHGVDYEPAGRELTCRSSSEETNFLALNLAADIAQGKMSPEDADRFFTRTVAESLSGRYSRYMQGLLFVPLSSAPGLDWRRERRW